jgi:hypothetical protein
VRFTASKREAYSGLLTIMTNEAVSDTYQINLLGSDLALDVEPPIEQLTRLEVTPNPARNNATLRITGASQLEDVKLNFYDATARVIATQNVGVLGIGEQNIPISLPAINGVVFLRITSGGETMGTVPIAIFQ